MYDKIKELGIDLFILITDYGHNKYVVSPFMYHANYNTYQLIFKFEDWTGIIDDGKEHMSICAEYVNAENDVLIKIQDEDFDSLLGKVLDWNNSHRIKIKYREKRHIHQKKRNKKRSGKNLFWLVRSTEDDKLMLFNRKPYKWKIENKEFAKFFKNGYKWDSIHGCSFLGKNKFPEVSYETDPVPVRLIIDGNNPDMYIQRCGDNLYINNRILKYFKYRKKFFRFRKKLEFEELPHTSARISNKLFPEVREIDGIAGVRIERIR